MNGYHVVTNYLDHVFSPSLFNKRNQKIVKKPKVDYYTGLDDTGLDGMSSLFLKTKYVLETKFKFNY